MKLSPTQRWVLLIGGLGASAWIAIKGQEVDVSDLAVPVVTSSNRNVPVRPVSASPTPVDALQLLVSREGLMPAADTMVRDLFAEGSWAPPPAPPSPLTTTAPTPPTAPPNPFAYVGKKWEGGVWEVYLAEGERTHIVHEGETINAQYRIDKIDPPSLLMTYLPLTQTQALAIGELQ